MVSKMTIKQKIEKGIIPEEIKEIAKKEEIDEKVLIESIKKGEVVIPANKKKKKRKLCGIGKGLSVKINTNIGTSPLRMNIKEEIEKLKIAEKYGTDTVMDLSLGAILAFISTANAGIMSSARYPLAMSKDGLLPSFLSKISSKFKTPYYAILFQTVITIFVLSIGSFRLLLEILLPLLL